MATTTRTARKSPARMAVAANGTRDAADAAVISITSKPRKTIQTLIDGMPYRVKIPKTGLTMKLAVHGKQAGEEPAQFVATMDEWIMQVFGSDQAGMIHDRLDDPEDVLDFESLTTLMEKLGEYESGDPTS